VEIKNFIKRIFFINLLIVGLIFLSITPTYANYNDAHAKNTAKIKKLKLLENIEHGKLYKNQQKLEDTQSSLQKSKENYTAAQNKLNQLQKDLSKSTNEYKNIDFQIRRRIRQIFKTQRKGFFELLLMSKDINEFSDRLYYEGIIIRKDFASMGKAREKAKEISTLKSKIEIEKRSISNSISVINREQNQLKKEIVKNQKMILKLKTDRKTYEKAERDLARNSSSIQSMLSHNTSKENALGTSFLWPVNGRITSPFGWRVHPIFKSRTFHSGIDIAAPFNTPVKASNSGTVIYVGWYGGYGKVVMIDHGRINGKSVTTLYAHLNSFNVSKGQKISKGDIIAREGTTGYSTGPHVHFEVRLNGKPQNPMSYL
jgi:murein DD-endopeptidase MepM/ murein hydrolase activator NlpD